VAKRWVIEPEWEGRAKGAALWGVPPLVAQLLYNRGLRDPREAGPFLAPKLGDLVPPEELSGVTRAAERIAGAVAAKRRIVLYGDYDVDGIMGIAILWHTLKLAGANVTFYVPDRLSEGYGLSTDALKALVKDGAELIVSIDCGIGAAAEAESLRACGVPLVVCDHHTLPAQLPAAEAIVHPGLDGYPNPHLCGAGAAFKLAWAVAQALCGSQRVSLEYRKLLMELLPLAALGTIADVVPLVGENRIIARCGLADLPRSPLPGVRALIKTAGLANSHIDGYDVGFKLAPRLNAAGRMGHARLAVELITRADEARAGEIAAYLDQQNRARQTVERRIAAEATAMVEALGYAGDAHRAIVVADEAWHPGVIGIVAARLVERFGRPAIVISTRDGQGQGSGRSIRHFDLTAALGDCAEHLETFGGHAQAAGLRIASDRIDAFRESFVGVANQKLTPMDLMPSLRLDGVTSIRELTLDTLTWIARIGPFGAGNPKPVFASPALALASEPRCVGKDSRHLQAVFAESDHVIKAIGFGMADQLEPLKDHRTCEVAFEPILNTFNGRRSVEMQIVDMRFPA